jgi:hypothetical protein
MRQRRTPDGSLYGNRDGSVRSTDLPPLHDRFSPHAGRIPLEEARQYVGKSAIVCGTVASVWYATESKGAPTFLHIGKPYPQQMHTGIIWDQARRRFFSPPEDLQGREVCIIGKITLYRGMARSKCPSQRRSRPSCLHAERIEDGVLRMATLGAASVFRRARIGCGHIPGVEGHPGCRASGSWDPDTPASNQELDRFR